MKWLGMEDPSWRQMMLTLVGLVVGLIIFISALLMLRYRLPPKNEAALLSERYGKTTRMEPRSGETAQDVALRGRESGSLQQQSVGAVTDAYMDARYGTGGGKAMEHLRNAVGSIR